MTVWYLSEDLAAEAWDVHIAGFDLTVDMILDAKGRA
jgi:hypothetical protein